MVEAIVSGMLIGIFYALVASGFSMIWAAMKIVNVAHAGFMVLAAYVAINLQRALGFDIFAGLLVVTPLLFVVGALIYRFVLSYSYLSDDFEIVSLVATFGLAIVLENALQYQFGPEQQALASSYAGPLSAFGIDVGRIPVISAVIALIATFGLYYLIYQTGLGRAVRAAWQDEDLAVLHGIDPERARLIMFSLATALAGIAGVLLPAVRSVAPAIHWDYIIIVFIIVIVGGVGSITGTLVTGLVLGVVEEIVPLFIATSWVPVILYLVLLAFLLWKPEGLFEGVA